VATALLQNIKKEKHINQKPFEPLEVMAYPAKIAVRVSDVKDPARDSFSAFFGLEGSHSPKHHVENPFI